MKPWPRMEKAVADLDQIEAVAAPGTWTPDERLDHFREHYPDRLGHITTWKGILYVLQATRRHLALLSELPKVPPASLVYHETVPELRFPFVEHLIVLSDLHAPAHDDRGVALFLKVIRELGITTCVINGDTFDNAYLGHGGIRNSRAASSAENLHAGASILNALTGAGIERAYALQGNHDDKPLRFTDGEILYDQWWAAQVSPLLDHPDRFTVTHRYYAIMEAMDPQPEGTRPAHFPTRFTHQREYGRPPLAVASRLADKFLMNVVTGHQHHLGFSRHKSGRLLIADAGTLQHQEGAEYKVNRDTTHPEWCPGFLTMHYGVPRVWPLDAPDEWWEWQLGGVNGPA